MTVDRAKLEDVRRTTGAASASEAVDIALTQLLRLDRLRRDVAAYAEVPPTLEEIALSAARPDWSALADDTDWDALYAGDAP